MADPLDVLGGARPDPLDALLPAEPQAPHSAAAVDLPNIYGNEFTKGLRRGALGLVGTTQAFGGQLAEPFSATKAAELFDAANKTLDFAPGLRPKVPTWDEVKDTSSFIDYGLSKIGESVPSTAASLAAAGAGGAAGLGLRALTGVRAPLGYAAGAASMLPQEGGEAALTMRNDPAAMAATTPWERTGLAASKGAIGAALEFAPEAVMLRQALHAPRIAAGVRPALGAIGRGIATNVAGEAATEGLQEVSGQAFHGLANPQRDSSQDLANIREAMLGGAFGGLGFGAVGGAGQALRSNIGAGVDAAKQAVPDVGVDLADVVSTVRKVIQDPEWAGEKAAAGAVELAEAAKTGAIKLGQLAQVAGEKGVELLAKGKNIVDEAIIAAESLDKPGEHVNREWLYTASKNLENVTAWQLERINDFLKNPTDPVAQRGLGLAAKGASKGAAEGFQRSIDWLSDFYTGLTKSVDKTVRASNQWSDAMEADLNSLLTHPQYRTVLSQLTPVEQKAVVGALHSFRAAPQLAKTEKGQRAVKELKQLFGPDLGRVTQMLQKPGNKDVSNEGPDAIGLTDTGASRAETDMLGDEATADTETDTGMQEGKPEEIDTRIAPKIDQNTLSEAIQNQKHFFETPVVGRAQSHFMVKLMPPEGVDPRTILQALKTPDFRTGEKRTLRPFTEQDAARFIKDGVIRLPVNPMSLAQQISKTKKEDLGDLRQGQTGYSGSRKGDIFMSALTTMLTDGVEITDAQGNVHKVAVDVEGELPDSLLLHRQKGKPDYTLAEYRRETRAFNTKSPEILALERQLVDKYSDLASDPEAWDKALKAEAKNTGDKQRIRTIYRVMHSREELPKLLNNNLRSTVEDGLTTILDDVQNTVTDRLDTNEVGSSLQLVDDLEAYLTSDGREVSPAVAKLFRDNNIRLFSEEMLKDREALVRQDKEGNEVWPQDYILKQLDYLRVRAKQAQLDGVLGRIDQNEVLGTDAQNKEVPGIGNNFWNKNELPKNLDPRSWNGAFFGKVSPEDKQRMLKGFTAFQQRLSTIGKWRVKGIYEVGLFPTPEAAQRFIDDMPDKGYVLTYKGQQFDREQAQKRFPKWKAADSIRGQLPTKEQANIINPETGEILEISGYAFAGMSPEDATQSLAWLHKAIPDKEQLSVVDGTPTVTVAQPQPVRSQLETDENYAARLAKARQTTTRPLTYADLEALIPVDKSKGEYDAGYAQENAKQGEFDLAEAAELNDLERQLEEVRANILTALESKDFDTVRTLEQQETRLKAKLARVPTPTSATAAVTPEGRAPKQKEMFVPRATKLPAIPTSVVKSKRTVIAARGQPGVLEGAEPAYITNPVQVDRFPAEPATRSFVANEQKEIPLNEVNKKAVGPQKRYIKSLTPGAEGKGLPGKGSTAYYEEGEQLGDEDLRSTQKRRAQLSSAETTFEESNGPYQTRTRQNAGRADATLAIAADFTTGGERATRTAVEGQKKLYIPVRYVGELATDDAVQSVVDKLNSLPDEKKTITLNIAGNGIYSLKSLGDQAKVDAYTLDLLRRVLEHPELKKKISRVRSGGQTGFDEAGVKAARALKIPNVVLAPKGWTFRDANKNDISDEAAFKARFNAAPAQPAAPTPAEIRQQKLDEQAREEMGNANAATDDYLSRTEGMPAAAQPRVTVTDRIIRRAELKANPDTIYLFGDNLLRRGMGGQAAQMRGEPNAIGIATKKLPSTTPGSYFIDEEFEKNKASLDADFAKIPKDRPVVVPPMGVGLAELPTRAPRTYAYLQQKIAELRGEPAPNVVNKKFEFDLKKANVEKQRALPGSEPITPEDVLTPDYAPGMSPEEVPTPEKVGTRNFTVVPKVTGENIASPFRGRNTSPLAAALTNVTYGKYPVDNVPGLKRPDPDGNHKLSAEAWYQANKTVSLSKNMAMMQRIIEAKLRQYPELVKQIDEKGGAAWIEASRHEVVGNKSWEGQGTASNFIRVLRDAYNAVKEGKPTPPTGTPRPLPMNYKDGEHNLTMRPEFRGKSTIDLIKSGDRTATSRRAKPTVAVGEILRAYDNAGNTVDVRVTSEPYKVSTITPEEWSKLEGWSEKDYNKYKDAWQFKYELVNKPTKAAKKYTDQEAAAAIKLIRASGNLTTKQLRDIADNTDFTDPEDAKWATKFVTDLEDIVAGKYNSKGLAQQTVNSWSKRFANGTPVTLVKLPKDNAFVAIFASAFGADTSQIGGLAVQIDGKHFIASFEGGMGEKSNSLSRLAHEFGHVLQKIAFDTAPESVRNKLMEQYKADLTLLGVNPASIERFISPARFPGELAAQLEPVIAGATQRLPAEQVAGLGRQTVEGIGDAVGRELYATAPKEQQKYLTSFPEWFAEQFSKYVTSRPEKSLDPELRSFWDKLYENIKNFYEFVIKQFRPNETFAEWVDNLAAPPAPQQQGELKFSKQTKPTPGIERVAKKAVEDARNTFFRVIRDLGGVSMDEARDITGETGIKANRGGSVFRKSGKALDRVAERLHELGYISDAEYNDVDGGVQRVRDLIAAAQNGEIVAPLDELGALKGLRAQATEATKPWEPAGSEYTASAMVRTLEAHPTLAKEASEFAGELPSTVQSVSAHTKTPFDPAATAGKTATLAPEPTNKFDPNAIRVLTPDGVFRTYVARRYTESMAKNMAKGYTYTAKFDSTGHYLIIRREEKVSGSKNEPVTPEKSAPPAAEKSQESAKTEENAKVKPEESPQESGPTPKTSQNVPNTPEAKEAYRTAPEKLLAIAKKMFGEKVNIVIGEPPKGSTAREAVARGWYMGRRQLNEYKLNEQKLKDVREARRKALRAGRQERVEELNQEEAALLKQMQVLGTIYLAPHLSDAEMLATYYHEAVHAAFDILLSPAERAILGTAFSRGMVRNKLETLFKDDPAVLEQIKDAEEAAAYGFQIYATSPQLLPLGPKVEGVFAKVRQFFKRALRILSPEEKAEVIMNDMLSGRRAETGISPLHRVWDKDESLKDRIIKHAGAVSGLVKSVWEKMLTPTYDRLIDMDNPAMEQVAKLGYNKTGEKGGPGMIQRMDTETTARLNWIHKLTKKYTEDVLRVAADARMNDTPPTDPKALAAYNDLTPFFDDFFRYARKAGVDIGYIKNYWPMLWDAEKVLNDREGFLKMITQDKYAEKLETLMVTPTELWENIAGYVTRGESFQSVLGPNMEPTNSYSRERSLGFLDPADRKPYMNDSPLQTLVNYTTQMVRQAEYVRAYGEKGEEFARLMGEAKEKYGATNEQLTLARDYLDGLLGNKEIGMSRELKDLFGAAIVYQNFRLLPYSLFSSLVDPLGIAVRSNNIGDAFEAFTYSMRNLFRDLKENRPDMSKDEWEKLAEDWGYISDSGTMTNLRHMAETTELHGLSRTLNDALFKWNLLNGWTRSTKIMALKAAARFMLRSAEGTDDLSKRNLEELGLKKSDIVSDGKGGIALRKDELMARGVSEDQAVEIEERLHNATTKFVNQAILNPTAADLPNWGSNPYMAPIFHLKQFMFTFQTTIIDRIINEAKQGNYKPLWVASIYVPGMIAADYMRGVLSNMGAEPPWQKDWGPVDYVANGVARSGLLGTGQMLMSMKDDVMHGGRGYESAIGPTIEQLMKGVEAMAKGNTHNFVVKAMPLNPIYDQWLLENN